MKCKDIIHKMHSQELSYKINVLLLLSCLITFIESSKVTLKFKICKLTINRSDWTESDSFHLSFSVQILHGWIYGVCGLWKDILILLRHTTSILYLKQYIRKHVKLKEWSHTYLKIVQSKDSIPYCTVNILVNNRTVSMIFLTSNGWNIAEMTHNNKQSINQSNFTWPSLLHMCMQLAPPPVLLYTFYNPDYHIDLGFLSAPFDRYSPVHKKNPDEGEFSFDNPYTDILLWP